MLILLAVALVVHRVFFSPSGILIIQDERAPWIMVDAPIKARLQQWGRVEAPVTRFLASFEATEPGPRARLALRSFGEARVFLNDVLASESDRDTSPW